MATLRNLHFFKKPKMKPKKALIDTTQGVVTVVWKSIDGKLEYSLIGNEIAKLEASEVINHLDKWDFVDSLKPKVVA